MIKVLAYFPALWLVAGLTSAVLSQSNLQPKNVVLITLDDAGYFDFGFNSQTLRNDDVVTPNIDHLRSRGRAMPNYYTASCMCSPTRVSLLTGCNPIRFGANETWPFDHFVDQEFPVNSGLPDSVPQLGKLLSALGMRTGHFGKWHVGFSRNRYRPDRMGFDQYVVVQSLQGNTTSWSGEFRFHDETGRFNDRDVDFVDEYLADRVLDFIEQQREQSPGFFVNFCPFTPHFPWEPPRGFDNTQYGFDLTTPRGRVLGMMAAIDHEIGRIVEKLESLGILDETLILLSSDNGAPRAVQNPERFLKGSKGNFLEAGIRVPLVAHWPDGISPNTTNESVMVSYDLLPTIISLLGRETSNIEPLIDGRDVSAALVSDEILSHEPIFWEIDGNSIRSSDQQAQKTFACRVGDLKLIKLENRNETTHARPYLLFDIRQDPQEKINLHLKAPEALEILKREMHGLRREISRFRNLPEFVLGSKRIQFDPRLDVGARDMTLVMDVAIPKEIPRVQNLFTKPGSFRVSLLRNGAIQWRAIGAAIGVSPASVVLRTPALPAGTHQLTLRVAGFKRDFSHLEMLVDDIVVADSDDEPAILSLWSTVSDIYLGDVDVVLDKIRFHTIKLWPSDLNED